ncbi:MAG TPA: hypothetical protein VLM40_22415, partial [Gemmata sp.]|nr:hypothetical protein [Gemmata sp.]
MARTPFAFLAAMALAGPTAGQPVNLAEKVAAGDRAKFTVDLDLKGDLYFVAEGKKEPLPLEAKARHIFSERVLTVADGLVYASARHYTEAAASAIVG